MHQLSLEAGLSENPKQLMFRILNRSAIYCRYDRAVLWSITGRKPRFLGVSGNCGFNAQSPLVDDWRRVIEVMPQRESPTILDPASWESEPASWNTLSRRTNGLSVVWLPIKVAGEAVAGLWLERWGRKSFIDGELAQLETLALSYGVAWQGIFRRRGMLASGLLSRKRTVAATIAALGILATCFVQVRLRIVAPCEVVPEDPLVIAAPLNGVIDEVPVLPGRHVEEGDLLAVYDKRVPIEEMKIADEQARIVASDLRRLRVEAFDNPSARAAIALLENKLAQEKIRLRLANDRVAQLEVRAPTNGTLMLDDPHEWRGRPVQVGQRLMMIVDPSNTKLRVFLPDGDNIEFDHDHPVKVILDSDPGSSRLARLRYLANHSQLDRKGKATFVAEAHWLNSSCSTKMGLQGTAVLYGQNVPLGYWLARRPLAAIRKSLGL
ncbi:MAG: HlyD family efflux transporter periplasmic adaptor subunit [Phycisphaerae bacterium]|nr:HlyD family efflux transporter periplasmic adaptor subunit [Phycisphaerae bacterium]